MKQTISFNTDSIQSDQGIVTTDVSNSAIDSVALISTRNVSTTNASQATYSCLGMWLGCGGILLGAMALYTLRQKTISFKRKLNSLVSDITTIRDCQNQQNDMIKMLQEKFSQLTRESVVKTDAKTISTSPQRIKTGDVETRRIDKKSKSKSLTEVRFANMQQLNNELRFAERTMDKNSSSAKMFLLELDYENGIGEYRINPQAIEIIMSDLQTFKSFVKPFDAIGLSSSSKITNCVAGKIQRQGDFWIVQDRLEITFK